VTATRPEWARDWVNYCPGCHRVCTFDWYTCACHSLCPRCCYAYRNHENPQGETP
jgi:hypothetical protein